MFGKVRWSQNMFLWIRKVFCSHPAYPKQLFAHTSLSKLIKNRIYQNFDRKSPKMRPLAPQMEGLPLSYMHIIFVCILYPEAAPEIAELHSENTCCFLPAVVVSQTGEDRTWR